MGEPPKHRDRQEWNEFVGDVKAASGNDNPLHPRSFHLREAIKAGNALFFVENTPVHILDLAFHLGLEGKEWRNARQKAAHEKIYTNEVIDVLDDMIAGTVINNEGSLVRRQDQRGEALAVLALLGDNDARETLDKKKDVMLRMDEEKDKQHKEFAERRYRELLAEGRRLPDKVLATHVTKYKPMITEKGVLIQSSFDGTNGVMTRNTIHFSLRGPISGAFGGGDWEAMPYVVTGDLSKIRDVNGNPLMINEIDTYFLVNPGQPLLIPEAELTMPGNLPKGTIEEMRGGTRFYKSKDLAPEDIDKLYSEYFDIFSGRDKEDIADFFFSRTTGKYKRSEKYYGIFQKSQITSQRRKPHDEAGKQKNVFCSWSDLNFQSGRCRN